MGQRGRNGDILRARGIKPRFFTDEDLLELPPIVRLLFAGLWCAADREGRLEDRPGQLKIDLFPCDTIDIDAALDLLAAHGDLIIRYTVAGQRYIAIPSFSKHQNPHHREPPSTIPPPESDGATPTQAPGKPGAGLGLAVLTPDSGLLTPDSGLLTPDSKPLLVEPKPAPRPRAATFKPEIEEVFAYWQQAMGKGTATLTPQRRDKIRTRLKDGYTVEQLQAAIDGCRASPHNMGDNDRNRPFNDLELILRNSTNVEKFMEIAPAHRRNAPPPTSTLVRPEMVALYAGMVSEGVRIEEMLESCVSDEERAALTARCEVTA